MKPTIARLSRASAKAKAKGTRISRPKLMPTPRSTSSSLDVASRRKASNMPSISPIGMPSERYSGIRLASIRRSEEHKSELQSLRRISYAVYSVKKKNIYNKKQNHTYKH